MVLMLTRLLLMLMLVNAMEVSSQSPELRSKGKIVSNTEQRKFIPTHEWQVIRDGQAVPAGLHYRMNLQTGLKEAKLLDEKNRATDPSSAVIIASHKGVSNEEVEENPNDLDSVHDADEQSTFRSYEYLKKEFQGLNLLVKTDLELLDELLARFSSKNIGQDSDEQEIITILTDLEYLVHHYDNAQEFARMGGFTQVVYPCLNASSVAIRSEAIKLLGSAIQSNPKVQIMALETLSISSLLRLLVLDNSHVVRARAVYALSCLTRRFPTAQLKMINGGGLSVLGELFQNEGQDDLQIQIKVITLLYDLVMEYKDADKALKVPGVAANHEELVEKQRQYKLVNLPQHLVESGWCQRFPRLLSVSVGNVGQRKWKDTSSSVVSEDLSARPEHDVVEKVIDAMLALVDYCINDFRADFGVKEIVASLEKWYGELSAREQLKSNTRNVNEISDHCFYFTKLTKQLQKLSEKLKSTKNEL